jgi:hypothetical protein
MRWREGSFLSAGIDQRPAIHLNDRLKMPFDESAKFVLNCGSNRSLFSSFIHTLSLFIHLLSLDLTSTSFLPLYGGADTHFFFTHTYALVLLHSCSLSSSFTMLYSNDTFLFALVLVLISSIASVSARPVESSSSSTPLARSLEGEGINIPLRSVPFVRKYDKVSPGEFAEAHLNADLGQH